jgi:hypothetical protein
LLARSFAAPLFMSRHLQAIDADLPLLHKPAEFARQHVEQFLRGASAAPVKPKAAPRGAVTRPRPAARRARRPRQPL